MARKMAEGTKRPRISIDLPLELRLRLRLAVARSDITVREYVLEALEAKLQAEAELAPDVSTLTERTDPVLADLWNNPYDAAYDRL